MTRRYSGRPPKDDADWLNYLTPEEREKVDTMRVDLESKVWETQMLRTHLQAYNKIAIARKMKAKREQQA